MRTLMGNYTKVTVLFFICSILIIKWVRSTEATRLTKEEDLELEKQLLILNKPSIKTIKSVHGDVYNCIDFYKQPAFDHPLLKNHSFHHEMIPNSNDSSENEDLVKIFEDGGCPTGSVPIRRMTKSDLIRQKRYYSVRPQEFGEDQFTDIAVVRSIREEKVHTYSQVSARFLVSNPPSNIAQYSASRLRIQGGPDAIQIGWRVDPALYGDNQTRLYTYFKAGAKNCYNTMCSGFVMVNKKYPIDYVMDKFYKLGDNTTIAEIKLRLTRDKTNGNWWIEAGEDNIRLGFWPAAIFTGLKSPATYADWGGEAYNSDKNDLVMMGLGHIPKPGDPLIINDYCREITVAQLNEIEPWNPTLYPFSPTTKVYATASSRYQAIDLDLEDDHYKHVAFYGGPNQ